MTIPAPRRTARVLELRQLSTTGYEIALERREFHFRPGEEIMVHGPDPTFDRTYSIASGVGEPDLRLLFRVIPTGKLSPRLAAMRAGDSLDYTGPFGSFVLRDASRPCVFIATGTGIAPCASFRLSHPDLKLTVFHGVRTEDDLFHHDLFAGCVYRPCVSREATTHFRGRVTDLLRDVPLDPAAHYYLCGANTMITDAYALLKQRSIADDAIFSEPYYFW